MAGLEMPKSQESRAWVRRLLPALAAVVLAIALVFVVGLVPAEAEIGGADNGHHGGEFHRRCPDPLERRLRGSDGRVLDPL